ncbi:unnamed protein product [Ilex paraguariensis]|uniref:cellulase n=1 Tax=Ilex paraguariensis TaxID=185542 RepID=A0ABC8S8A3_9AQUA
MEVYARALAAFIVGWFALFHGLLIAVNGEFDYADALTKSIIFLEAQRSGKLPPNHRPSWRGDSALEDGKLANVDLVGGYYDAGDNVKYGLPMAFTVTTLSWAAIFYESELKAAGEMENVRAAIRWGTDYFIKASSRRDCLYVQANPLSPTIRTSKITAQSISYVKKGWTSGREGTESGNQHEVSK